jgi:hypothetical protein
MRFVILSIFVITLLLIILVSVVLVSQDDLEEFLNITSIPDNDRTRSPLVSEVIAFAMRSQLQERQQGRQGHPIERAIGLQRLREFRSHDRRQSLHPIEGGGEE